MAGFYNHIWYKLLSEEGVPLSGASILLYDYSNPTVQLLTYNASGGALTQPLITDNNGVFDFYVRDHILKIIERKYHGQKANYRVRDFNRAGICGMFR